MYSFPETMMRPCICIDTVWIAQHDVTDFDVHDEKKISPQGVLRLPYVRGVETDRPFMQKTKKHKGNIISIALY